MAKASFSHYQSYTTQKKNRERAVRIVLTCFLVYLGYLVLNSAFLRTVRWESVSMEPTLKKDTLVLLTPLPLGNNNLPYLPLGLPGWRGPERGELVEVVPGYHTPTPPWITAVDEFIRFFTLNFLSLDEGLRPAWDRDYTLRRVVGLPGDVIKIDNFIAYVKPQGEKYFLSEYELSKKIYSVKEDLPPENWKSSYPLSGSMKEIQLGEDEYFVLSDNRATYSDSRTWGVLKKNAFKASALLKYWPLGEFGGL